MGIGRDYCEGGARHWRSRVRRCDLCGKCPKCAGDGRSVMLSYELTRDYGVCGYCYTCTDCRRNGDLKNRAEKYHNVLCDRHGKVTK
jgi:hypothetical protein